jgi:chorismate--pyruvate lyase
MRRISSAASMGAGWRTTAGHATTPGVSRDPGSLTAALRRTGRVEVRLLSQRRGKPDRHERRMLGRAAARGVVLREILLLCGDVPVIYGRTAIVARDLRGAWRALSSLGTRALGDFIFSDRAVVRGPFVLKKFAPSDRLLRRIGSAFGAAPVSLTRPPRVLGARRRRIARHRRSIVLTEAFLDGFPAGAKIN